MADLMVRRGGSTPSAETTDPFRTMREQLRRMQDLFGWDPFAEMTTGFGEATPYVPRFEVRDTHDGIVFLADVPGVGEQDIEITVVGNRLRIQGQRALPEAQQGETWYTAERPYGKFARSFILPDGMDLDNIQATVENGVLRVCVAKGNRSQPRRVTVGQGRGQSGQIGQQGQSGAVGQPGQQGQSGVGQSGVGQSGVGQSGQVRQPGAGMRTSGYPETESAEGMPGSQGSSGSQGTAGKVPEKV